MCRLKGESANCLSLFYRVSYESLTCDLPGKVNLFVNQRCPLINVSINQRVHCTCLGNKFSSSNVLSVVQLSKRKIVKKRCIFLKFKNKFTRAISLVSFWCLHWQLRSRFTNCQLLTLKTLLYMFRAELHWKTSQRL